MLNPVAALHRMQRLALLAAAGAVRSASASPHDSLAPPAPSWAAHNSLPLRAAASPAPEYALHFVAESTYLPDPDKLASGRQGEDAGLVSRYALGVADGVGSWTNVGVDAGLYSRSLMRSAGEAASAATAAAEAAAALADASVGLGAGAGGVALDPAALLVHAHNVTHFRGSSTAVLATTGSDGTLAVLNLGDSGAMVWRRSTPPVLGPTRRLPPAEAELLWSPLLRTREQTHYFNCPLQLMHGEGGDPPSSAAGGVVSPSAGDLVLLATDGVFDNLFERDIQRLLGRVEWAPCAAFIRLKKARYAAAAEAAGAAAEAASGRAPVEPPAALSPRILNLAQPAPVSDFELAAAEKACRSALLSMAAIIAVGAQRVGGDPTAMSPFAAASRAPGSGTRPVIGGKMDDAYVVLGLLVPDERHAGRRRGL